MREKKNHHDLRTNPHPDPITRGISEQLARIPRCGSHISRLYLWRYSMINTMIVGASGMILSFLIYEGFLRWLMIGIWRATFLGIIFPWAATFLGMIITTFLVFFWNYFWNRHWSLSINAQLYSMKEDELFDLMLRIEKMLYEANPDDFFGSAQS